MEVLVELLRRRTVILLDFDGPVCSVFAGYSTARITERFRALTVGQVGELPAALDGVKGPHEFLSVAAGVSRELGHQVEEALQVAEVEAVESATPTPGADEFLAACREAGRALAIVSNNTGASVRAYLERAGLAEFVQHIEARDPADPALMKPNPYLIEKAAEALAVAPNACTLIGDQTSDVKAAQVSGTASIGYATTPAQANHLAAAGADAVVTHIDQLTKAIRATG